MRSNEFDLKILYCLILANIIYDLLVRNTYYREQGTQNSSKAVNLRFCAPLWVMITWDRPPPLWTECRTDMAEAITFPQLR